jgi:hypothetical protein
LRLNILDIWNLYLQTGCSYNPTPVPMDSHPWQSPGLKCLLMLLKDCASEGWMWTSSLLMHIG